MKQKPRRATFALGTGGLGALTSMIEQITLGFGQGEAATDWWHPIVFLGFGVLTYVIEKGVDLIRDRTGIDLTPTAASVKRALSDGKLSQAETRDIFGTLASDLYPAADALIERHGLEQVVTAVQDRIAETGVDAGGGPSAEDAA